MRDVRESFERPRRINGECTCILLLYTIVQMSTFLAAPPHHGPHHPLCNTPTCPLQAPTLHLPSSNVRNRHT